MLRRALRHWPTLALLALFIGLLGGARVLAQTAAAQDTNLTQPATEARPSGEAAAGSAAGAAAAHGGAQDGFDFFSDQPVHSTDVVELPPEKSRWITVGGPVALVLFLVLLLGFNWWMVPFSSHSVDINLRDFPPAAKRGIALAVTLFGIAFAFGASEIWYQMQIYGSTEAFFAQMSVGKLIVMTHAHLFGFTTSFFIIGIPFSMQFNQLKLYQWIFPIGLAASLTDVLSWWGIKFLSANFEYVSMLCGMLFSASYLWMLIGLLRVLLFPEVIWVSDKDRRQRLSAKAEQRQASRHHEGDY